MPDSDLYRRVDLTVPRYLYSALASYIPKDASPAKVFSIISCPVNPRSEEELQYWLACAVAILQNRPIPEPIISTSTLSECECAYHLLDIQHQMGRRSGVEINNMETKNKVSEQINTFLKATKAEFLRRCSTCGKILPVSSTYGMCEDCYRKMRMQRSHYYYGWDFDDDWDEDDDLFEIDDDDEDE